MRVLVACEFSGIVRDAFRARGHDAVSVDLLDTERPGPHIRGDLFNAFEDGPWDMVLAFPPCTALCSAGNRWYAGTRDRTTAVHFVRRISDLPVPRLAIENPVGVLSTRMRKPDQIVQPWWFGHGETKATCLWLRGLPALTATDVVDGRRPRVWKAPDSLGRWKSRSRTPTGLAAAMAAQWGG